MATHPAAIIFGARGQDGYYLTKLLRLQGVEPIPVSRSPGADWIVGDVADRAQVEALIRGHQPAYIFHLAANSTTQLEALFENHETIATGSLNILEAVRAHCPQARVFLTGSGLQFENRGKPISENDPFSGSSAYAVARIHSAYAGRYFRSLGLKVYIGYFFHHESPRRGPRHVSQIIVQAARRIRDGSDEVLELGDITVCKEWGFAGDVIRGIWMLVQQDKVFEATVGTGTAYSIADWLEVCFQHLGCDWRPHVRIRDGFVPEYKCLISDPATIRSLGWNPEIDLPELAKMMLATRPQDESST